MKELIVPCCRYPCYTQIFHNDFDEMWCENCGTKLDPDNLRERGDTTMKKIDLAQIYTSDELAKAAQHVLNPPKSESVADAIMRDVTLPSLHRVNETTGQENNAKYLAYALEYALGTALRKGDKQ